MAGVNQYKTFAAGTGANTLTTSAWAALTTLLDKGFVAGVAASEQFNTLMRQVSVAVTGVAQFGVAQSGGDALDNGDPAAFAALLLAAVQAVVDSRVAASAVPAGIMAPFARGTVPAGWLECDGSSQLIAAYPNLSAAIRSVYGGADINHFYLPDTRGVVLRGWDHGRGLDAGRVLGSYQADDNKSHTHNLRAANYQISIDDTPGRVLRPDFAVSGEALVEASGGSEARMKNLAVLVCIKT